MKILKKGFRSVIRRQIVSNKTDRRISKRWLQENKARQLFQENEDFLTPVMRRRTCAYLGFGNVHFSENVACFVFF